MKVGRVLTAIAVSILYCSIGSAQLIKAFSSTEVADNFKAELKGNKTDVLKVVWTSASLNKPNVSVNYSFQIDTIGGDFNNPWVIIGGACCPAFFQKDTVMEIPYDYLAGEIDAVLNSKFKERFRQGDSITLEWAIMCNATGPNATYENRLSQTKTITIVRGQFDTEYLPIALTTPLDNSSFVVQDNPNVNLKFQWTGADCPAGCAAPQYTIMFDSMGGDFSNPLYFFKVPQSAFDTLLDLRQDVLAQMMYDDGVPINTPKTYKWTVEVFGNGEQFFAMEPKRVSLLRGLMRFENTPFFLQQPIDNAVFKVENNTNDSIIFSWNKTQSGFPDAAKYSVLFSSSADFSNPLFKLNTTAGDTTYIARYGEIRDSLDKQFGKNWTTQDLKWIVEADIIGYKFLSNDTNDLRIARGFFTSIKEITAQNIRVYPNPTVSNLTISIDAPEQLSQLFIYDALGRIILNEKLRNTAKEIYIDVSSLQKGVYYLRFQSVGGVLKPIPFVKQ